VADYLEINSDLVLNKVPVYHHSPQKSLRQSLIYYFDLLPMLLLEVSAVLLALLFQFYHSTVTNTVKTGSAKMLFLTVWKFSYIKGGCTLCCGV